MMIRPATPADIPAMQAVARAAWWATYADAYPADFIEGGLAAWWSDDALRDLLAAERGWLATVEGEAAGVLIGEVRGEVVTLEEFYVVPRFQGQGIGRALWEAYRAALADEVERVRVTVLGANGAARAFYAHLGFETTNTRELLSLGTMVRLYEMQLDAP